MHRTKVHQLSPFLSFSYFHLLIPLFFAGAKIPLMFLLWKVAAQVDLVGPPAPQGDR